MSEDTTFDEESEIVHFPKIDRSRLYSILIILGLILVIYITIMTNTLWIAFFIIIPFLSLAKREEPTQGKTNLKRLTIDGFSNLVKIISVLIIIVISIFLLIRTGVIITSILICISFILFNSINSAITRRNFEKSKKLKSEVS